MDCVEQKFTEISKKVYLHPVHYNIAKNRYNIGLAFAYPVHQSLQSSNHYLNETYLKNATRTKSTSQVIDAHCRTYKKH